DNIRDSVEARQPRTYAERVALSQQWKKRYDIASTVLVDDPENFFWSNFGQAPNMAYIIEPDCTVYYKQSWFNNEKFEEQILSATE
ncbi:MAG TPA: hypothetical protein VIN08_01880, partial [Ohtaekwangia sp.]